MQENLVFLREYARLLLIEEDETLTPVEDFKDVLMQEFLEMGTYLKLTEPVECRPNPVLATGYPYFRMPHFYEAGHGDNTLAAN